jgi:hypothetical protein
VREPKQSFKKKYVEECEKRKRMRMDKNENTWNSYQISRTIFFDLLTNVSLLFSFQKNTKKK